MIKINGNFNNLSKNYLFVDIEHRLKRVRSKKSSGRHYKIRDW